MNGGSSVMNKFKVDLHRELQTLSLSKERKQQISTKAKTNTIRAKRHSEWKYRIVLVTCTILTLGFSYLLWQQKDPLPLSPSQTAASNQSDTTTIWMELNNDFIKSILLVSIFVLLYIYLKRRLRKKGKGLPVCVKCNEEWSYGEALKCSMKNGEITCPKCKQKQYRTKKSSQRGGLIGFLIPFMILVSQIFNNTLIGIVVYFSCLLFIYLGLTPYYIELQEEDPINEPLY